ncbi:ABC transporter ATP-binding protein [Candidatus Riflebacteria bacterium]
MSTPLEVCNLSKSFKGDFAVKDLSFSTQPGQCLALLGPNGAGKTTAIKCLYGFLTPDSGEIYYFGRSFCKNRDWVSSQIGVLSQEDNLDYDFSVLQNLLIYFRYFNLKPDLKKGTELLQTFDILEKKDAMPITLSGGMKRRLQMARSLVNSPKILFLDEPSTGLDPQARHHLWKIIFRLKARGILILLTTHYMDEAEKLADNIILIDKGKKLVEGDFKILKEKHFHGKMVLTPENGDVTRSLKELNIDYSIFLEQVQFNCPPEGLSRFLELNPQTPYTVREPNLEDLFLKLTGTYLRE